LSSVNWAKGYFKKVNIPSSQPSPQRGEGVVSSSPPLEERIEVRRDLDLFQVIQISLMQGTH